MIPVKKAINKMWTCPRCGRQFERQGQMHSCRPPYPLPKHFEGKPGGKILYEKFKGEIRKKVGPFKVESLECCIHFVSKTTFAAVLIYRDKIRVDFSLGRKIRNSRIIKSGQLSARRYVYYVDIWDENEINKELLQWIEESFNKI